MRIVLSLIMEPHGPSKKLSFTSQTLRIVWLTWLRIAGQMALNARRVAARMFVSGESKEVQCKRGHAKRQFTAKIGTIFEDSPLSLQTWLPAVWLIATAKNGVSSCEIARSLGVTQKTAWVHASPHPQGHGERLHDEAGRNGGGVEAMKPSLRQSSQYA